MEEIRRFISQSEVEFKDQVEEKHKTGFFFSEAISV